MSIFWCKLLILGMKHLINFIIRPPGFMGILKEDKLGFRHFWNWYLNSYKSGTSCTKMVVRIPRISTFAPLNCIFTLSGTTNLQFQRDETPQFQSI
ncbi:hypothetical protein HanPI659440_Chr14g0548621 [Helianthus annuus]|nr:hypothetical protein HanPI659440_Chr16g0619451 [Helianthus annuus]KAJ0703231.1 hypothetical protein HanPI659440_Chr14g0548621 [Helianthus annuus]